MTWTSFIISLIVIYLLYYAVNVAYDLLFATTAGQRSKDEEIVPLTFEDDVMEKEIDVIDPIVEILGYDYVEEELSIERKEVITRENLIEGGDYRDDTIVPSGSVQALVGGVDLKTLLKHASFGALETTRKINFTEA